MPSPEENTLLLDEKEILKRISQRPKKTPVNVDKRNIDFANVFLSIVNHMTQKQKTN